MLESRLEYRLEWFQSALLITLPPRVEAPKGARCKCDANVARCWGVGGRSLVEAGSSCS